MKKKTLAILFFSIAFACLGLAGCSTSYEETEDTSEETSAESVTGSGAEYIASVSDDGSAYIEYLGATLDINEGEFMDDDFFDEDLFCLHMTYTNDLGNPNRENDDEFEKDSLDASFVIQALQDGEVIDPRSEVEAETIEEENCYERIDQGQTIECEMYFEVDTSEPVTIQVLNPDGQDTVMAEINYAPGDDDWD